MCQQCVVYISVLSPDRAPVGSNVGRFVGQLLPLPPSSAFTGLGNVWLSDRPFTSAGRDCASAAFSSIVYAVRKYIHLQCPPAIPTDERWMTFCQQFARTRGGGGGRSFFIFYILLDFGYTSAGFAACLSRVGAVCCLWAIRDHDVVVAVSGVTHTIIKGNRGECARTGYVLFFRLGCIGLC